MNIRVCVGPMLYMCEKIFKCIQYMWVCMCVLISALVGQAMMTKNCCWLGEETVQVHKIQTCERALHLVVTMQALIKLAEKCFTGYE